MSFASVTILRFDLVMRMTFFIFEREKKPETLVVMYENISVITWSLLAGVKVLMCL
jgi:hypothetical protein